MDKSRPFRNPRRTDWNKFGNFVADIQPPEKEMLDTQKQLDESVCSLTSSLKGAYEYSCKISHSSRKFHQPWWNPRLAKLRKEYRKLLNRAKRKKDPKSWDDCRRSFNTFKRECRMAKKESWKKFCGDLENTSDASRLRKVLSKDPGTPEFLMNPDGSFTESSNETLELLMKTHFPGCREEANEEIELESFSAPSIHISELVASIVNEERVAWAVSSFEPYKSPGPDGIFPALLQRSLPVVMPWLVVIFRSSLELSYIPREWREVRVVFIPKAGKINHNTAKDYRPISLSSFLLKTLERLIDVYVRGILTPQNFCWAQHAYQKGKSVETALHDVVGTIEDTLQKKEFLLASFLDIEGAFNNVKISSILDALSELGIDQRIINWTGNMLKDRVINSSLGIGKSRKIVTRGTPQGGVISPLLWNLVVNKILFELSNKGTKVVAYADDVVLLIKGKFLSTVSELMESALGVLLEWAKKNGLGVNPSKTELVLFTRKYKVPVFKLPRLGGISLELSKEAKYLGVILDSKLSWKRNAENRMQKALCAFYMCKKTFGKRWGLKPYIVHWMYTAVIRPILTYGALVWWKVIDTKTHISILNKVQRLSCLAMTGAIRSTPQASLEIMLDVPPLDVFIRTLAAKSALRLKESGELRHMHVGHGTVLGGMDRSVKFQRTDYLLPKSNFGKTFRTWIPSREEWAANSVFREYAVSVFTDGSKNEAGTGSGVFSEDLDISLSLRLPDSCTVFQAEVYAINMAARKISQFSFCTSTVDIYVDSLAAIKALNSNVIKSRCLYDCVQSLNLISHHHVELIWVPGHQGIKGNEKADECAVNGSFIDETMACVDVLTPLVVVANKIDDWALREVTTRWSTINTCRISRMLWPYMSRRRTQTLLSFDRSSIRLLIGVITGHCMIGRMSDRMGYPGNDFCRSCLDEEEEETIQHLLCDCPALQERRQKFLGTHIFRDLECLKDVPLINLLRFVKSTGWLQQERNVNSSD